MNFCFANLVRGFRRTAPKLYSGSRKLRSTCSGNIRPVRRTLPLIWLRAKRALLWMRKKKRRKMDDRVDTSLVSEGICLFVDLWEAQPCPWDPKWYSSWITLRGMIKVYDLTLAYILDHAVCCASAASSGRSSHLIRQLRTKHSSSNCPNHVRRTKRSIKKQIIVRGIARSMIGEQTVCPIKNGL